jgi:hypothetical protein
MLEALSMNPPMISRNTEEFKEAFDSTIQYFTTVDELTEDMFSISQRQKYREKAKEVSKYHINLIADQHTKLYEKLVDA